MTDAKTSLATAEAAIQAAAAACESESATLTSALAAANADRDALATKVAAQAATILDLQAQLAAAKPDPWAAIDKTGKTLVGDAFQKLLDDGHTDIPGGTYLLDPNKPILFDTNTTGAKNPDGTPAVYLVAKPSPTPRDAIARVAGAGISVKNIHAVGDRMAQAYTAGSTNEWGYGWVLAGAGSTLENCYASLCTGDGIGAVGPNITVKDCVADRNRRQGLSGFNCPGLKIIGGAYTNTGTVTVDGVTDAGAPNGPWAGIDIEPDASPAGKPPPNVVVSIKGAKVSGNKGSGILGYLRSEVGGTLNITIEACDIDGNVDGVRGEALAGKVTMTVNRNSFARHKGAAVRANSGSAIAVGSTTDAAQANLIQGLKPRTTTFTKAGIVTPYDLKQYGTGVINAGINSYA